MFIINFMYYNYGFLVSLNVILQVWLKYCEYIDVMTTKYKTIIINTFSIEYLLNLNILRIIFCSIYNKKPVFNAILIYPKQDH